MMKKTCLLLLLCITVLLSSCSFHINEEQADEIKQSGEISLFAYTPDTLNPLKTEYKTNASLLSALLYVPLVRVNPDFSVSPALAEKWSFSADGSTCVLTLKKGVLFSDGTPLTTENVISSFELVSKHPNNMFYGVTDYVQSISGSGNSVTLHLKKSGSGVLAHLTFPILKDESSLVGCGPYTLSKKEKNGLTFTAVSADTAFITPHIQTVHVKYYPKSEMWASSFLSSETDVIAADMATLSKINSKTNVTASEFTTDTFTYLGFNCNSEVITDKNARKAIGYLIDKDTMLNSLFVGYALKTNSPFKPKTTYANLYNGDFNYNKELAQKYFKDSETNSNLQFSILINEENDTKKRIADFIAGKLNQTGMFVTVLAVPFEEYTEKIASGDYTAYIGEVNIPADQDMRFLLGSGQNNLNFSSAYMDTLLSKFASETSEKEKKVCAQEIQKQLLDQAPLISLYYETNVLMVSDSISGTFAPLSSNLYNGIENWTAK